MLRPRITYANVVATLALFVALGGSAYAVSKITGADVQDRSLTSRDLRSNSTAIRSTAMNESVGDCRRIRS
jgi:hypothetical protein